MADEEDNIEDAASDAENGSDQFEEAPPPKKGVDLQQIGDDNGALPAGSEKGEVHTSTELEPVFDVPVNVQAVLGKSHLEVSQLLKLGPGAVIELDRKVGEAIDIYVNDRLVARGEVVLIDEHLGVTMTEIIKGDRV